MCDLGSRSSPTVILALSKPLERVGAVWEMLGVAHRQVFGDGKAAEAKRLGNAPPCRHPPYIYYRFVMKKDRDKQ